MSRIISATRKIQVNDSKGESYLLTFKIPSQSKLRAMRKACLAQDGNIDNPAFMDKITEATVDMFLEVEGARAGFDGNADNDFDVCSTVSEDHIRKIKEFHDQNGMEYCDYASGWKAAFITLFRDIFEAAELSLWSNPTEVEVVSGK